MKQKNLRRLIAGASAVTLTAGLAAAFGMSTATADSQSVSWTETVALSNYHFERTISDTNPAVGDPVTISTRFYNPPVSWQIQAVKELHDPCLVYVPDSATFNGKAISAANLEVDSSAGFVRGKNFTDEWVPMSSGSRTFSVTYLVGETCALNVALPTTVHYSTNLVSKNDSDRGPAITVKQAASTTALTIAPKPEAGTTSTLTATVTPDAATGEVEFFNGNASLGKANLADQKASIDWKPALDQGGQNYSITAKYLGDTNRTGSASAAATGTIDVGLVAPAAPGSLTSSRAQATVGEEVTISGRAEANSDVKVTAGAQSCDAKTNSNGAFSCSFTPNSAGKIDVTAKAANAAGTGPASAPLVLTVNDAPIVPVAPSAPELSLSPSSVKVGETVIATITTVPHAVVAVTVEGDTFKSTANAEGIATHSFEPTQAGTTTVSVTATNDGGASPVTVKDVEVTPAPLGQTILSVNPTAPVAGQTVKLTVSGVDENSAVTITADGVEVCARDSASSTTVECDWAPGAGTYELTIVTTVDGAEQTVHRTVTVSEEPGVDPGPGDGTGSGSSSGSLGSLGSVSGIFGSLN